MTQFERVYDVIFKNWKGPLGCPKGRRERDGIGRHWAVYVFQDEDDQKYWLTECIDEVNRCWWRHYQFMSIPCSKCGAYSPLRADTQFSTNLDGEYDRESCSQAEIIDYRPDDELPPAIARYREKGWTYYFFVETLSDSLCGQETFRLKSLPEFLKEKE